MTKGERADLCTLIRKREKLAKCAAAERAAELRANFEAQLAAIYSYDQDEVWQAAAELAEQAVEAAQAKVAKRCAELGIPKDLAPSIEMYWRSRGQNAIKERRAELRRVADTRIAALLKSAHTKIELQAVALQEEVIRGALLSTESRSFFDRLPAPESLMPMLDARALMELRA